MQRPEELAFHFVQSVHVKAEVVPRRRIGQHVPAQNIRTVSIHGRKRIHCVAQSLGHLLPIFIQDQAVRNHILIGHFAEHHRRNRVQGKEPAARLIYTFRDEICRICASLVYFFLILERIVPLGIRHRTTVEPDIDQIALTVHRLSAWTDENDLVHQVTVEVHTFVVFSAHIARREIC
ncbi:MAG: Uncharacterised protein [Cryomorphaceae bacterium]|nr:MAG: Uncharacterised protein [Cryomorphaceae bacterium]